MLSFFFISSFIPLVILVIFYFSSKKDLFDFFSSSGFECGFSSYFSSRFSFSVHYFLISLVFLFFDLELSFIFFFFLGGLSSFFLCFILMGFVSILLGGLFLEWWENNLDWVY